MVRAYRLSLAGLVLSMAALSACGASSPSGPRANGVRQRAPTGLEGLVGRLPEGADRCAAARPGTLAARHRRLFGRLSQIPELAWLPGAPFAEVASAGRSFATGGRAEVVLVALSDSAESARARLEERGGEAIRWGQRAAPGRAWGGSFEQGSTLRLERGAWLERSGAGAARARCLALLREAPGALEVSVRHPRAALLGRRPRATPTRIETVVRAGARSIEIARRFHLPTETLAEDLIENIAVPHAGVISLGGTMTSDVRELRREGAVVLVSARVFWDDLRLLQEDERREANAEREVQARRRPRPLEEVDVTNLTEVTWQLGLWQRVLEGPPSPERTEAVVQLTRLLDAATREHPHEVGLSEQLLHLLLVEHADGRMAAALASEVLSRGPPNPERWRIARRRGLSLVGRAELARALADDGLADRRVAERAARDLVRLVGEGQDYVAIEGALIGAERLDRRGGRFSMRPIRETPLQTAGLIDALSLLFEIGGARLGAVYVLARRTDLRRREDVQRRVAFGPFAVPEAPLLMDVTDRAGRPLIVGVTSITSTGALAALGHQVQVALGDGPVDLSTFFVPFDGTDGQPSHGVRIAGRMENGVLRVRSVSRPAQRARWPLVARYVVAPLSVAERRLFPPPELRLEAEDPESLAMLVDGVGSEGPCVAEGLIVRCASPGHDAVALRALLRSMVGGLLREDAGRLALP